MPAYGKIRLERQKVTSGIVAIGANVTIDLDPDFTHNFAAVEFFSDADGTAATPTRDTITFTAETEELPGVFQDITNGTVTVTSNRGVNFSGNVTRLRAAFSSITGATHCRLNANGNLS